MSSTQKSPQSEATNPAGTADPLTTDHGERNASSAQSTGSTRSTEVALRRSTASKGKSGDSAKFSPTASVTKMFRSLTKRWSSSLLLRTVTLTALMTVLATGVLAVFLIHQVTTGLYQSRFSQVQAEANHGLNQARQVFDNAATGDQESTASLVTDTLEALSGTTGASIAREFVLVPLYDEQNLFVGSMTSAGVTEDIITDELNEQVRESNGIYWQSVAFPREDGSTGPGLAFGTQVILPPGNYYALYFIYDLSEVQETVDYLMNLFLIVGLLLLALNIGIAYFTSRSVVRPIQEAAESAEWLASGDYSARMKVKRQDEVGRLSESFNTMADNIQDQITQLADLSKIQQRFVSDVSHELRTPLTTVRMAAEVLYDSRDEFDPVNRRSTELLYHQVERFQALLADLLEVSRFDAGAAKLAVENTDLVHLLADVLLTAQPLADSTDTELFVVTYGTNFDAEVDSRRIERILRNLVNNAIEHGESRPVTVVVGENENSVAIAVVDQGIGLSEEELSHVFQRFWRADPARTRTTGGSGLGLAIAVEDTRLHQGQLDVWGEKGVGAAFRLILPRRSGQSIGTEEDGDFPMSLPPLYDSADLKRPLDIISTEDSDDVGPRYHTDRITEQALHLRKRSTGETND